MKVPFTIASQDYASATTVTRNLATSSEALIEKALNASVSDPDFTFKNFLVQDFYTERLQSEKPWAPMPVLPPSGLQPHPFLPKALVTYDILGLISVYATNLMHVQNVHKEDV